MSEKKIVELSPRRVWLGITIPGKKMVKAMGHQGREAEEVLQALYQEMDYVAVLLAVDDALRAIAKGEGTYGPAARDLMSTSLTPDSLIYGAVLTDIRDFMKLRFRASGIPSPEITPKTIASGSVPQGINLKAPAWVIKYVITALDVLLQDPEGNADVRASTLALARLLRATAKDIWQAEMAHYRAQPGGIINHDLLQELLKSLEEKD